MQWDGYAIQHAAIHDKRLTRLSVPLHLEPIGLRVCRVTCKTRDIFRMPVP
jgi:hypothetical protein